MAVEVEATRVVRLSVSEFYVFGLLDQRSKTLDEILMESDEPKTVIEPIIQRLLELKLIQRDECSQNYFRSDPSAIAILDSK